MCEKSHDEVMPHRRVNSLGWMWCRPGLVFPIIRFTNNWIWKKKNKPPFLNSNLSYLRGKGDVTDKPVGTLSLAFAPWGRQGLGLRCSETGTDLLGLNIPSLYLLCHSQLKVWNRAVCFLATIWDLSLTDKVLVPLLKLFEINFHALQQMLFCVVLVLFYY